MSNNSELLDKGYKALLKPKTRSQRNLNGLSAIVLTFIAVSMSIFQLYSNSFGLIPEMQKTNIHVAFLLALAFYLYPAKLSGNTGNPKFYDYILVFFAAMLPLYMAFRYTAEFARVGDANNLDIFVGTLTIVFILEAARRTLGPIIPIISIIFMLYALFGSYAPGIFKFRSVSFYRLIFRIYLTTDGLWGLLVLISASFLFLFILFGSFLDVSGGSKAFNDIGFALGGRLRGGPAQVAVISSALMGSINGSAVANVMTTGTFTIPLMKKLGYKSEFAAGVEAAASTGGVLTPPVMGAVAFMMASTLGVSYTTIAAAAILPAILYYVSIGFSVDLEACKLKLAGIPKEELPRIRDVLMKKGIYLLPVFIIAFMLIRGKTPIFAGFFGIISAYFVSWVTKETRMGINKLKIALENGARSAVTVGVACCCCSFIVCIATMTGIGSTLAVHIINLSGGIPIIALFFIATIVLLMSLGMPGNVVYIIVAVIASPALVRMGFDIIPAHFFVMWIGAMSNMTPPVCMASFAAASIANSSINKTALAGLKLASAGLIVPFIFVFNPVMLMQNATPLNYFLSFVSGLVGVCSLAVGIHGFFKVKLPWYFRLPAIISALSLISPGHFSDLAGYTLLGVSYFLLNVYIKNEK